MKGYIWVVEVFREGRWLAAADMAVSTRYDARSLARWYAGMKRDIKTRVRKYGRVGK